MTIGTSAIQQWRTRSGTRLVRMDGQPAVRLGVGDTPAVLPEDSWRCRVRVSMKVLFRRRHEASLDAQCHHRVLRWSSRARNWSGTSTPPCGCGRRQMAIGLQTIRGRSAAHQSFGHVGRRLNREILDVASAIWPSRRPPSDSQRNQSSKADDPNVTLLISERQRGVDACRVPRG
jgi:hypothetical protein